MILVRFFLVSLIVYLVIRSFLRFSKVEESSKLNKDPEKGTNLSNKKISKEVGEYIDYEEIDGEK